LAAKKPFLVATIPGQEVAVCDTWPNDTLVAETAGPAPKPIACRATTAGRVNLDQRRIRVLPRAQCAPPFW
jgi:hypothetical protein